MITPWKCSECGVCVAACSNGGLDGLKLRQLTSLGPVSVYKCTKTLCKECGKPIAPNCADGICSVCRIKLRTKNGRRRLWPAPRSVRPSARPKRLQKQLQRSWQKKLKMPHPLSRLSAAAPPKGEPLAFRSLPL